MTYGDQRGARRLDAGWEGNEVGLTAGDVLPGPESDPGVQVRV